MSIIKLKSVELENFKNVEKGRIYTDVNFETLTEGNVLGVYGQNGSGKTALVEVLKILNNLLKKRLLPSEEEHLIMVGKECIKLKFDFLLSNNYGEYFIQYNVTLRNSEKPIKDEIRLIPVEEELLYKENAYKKRFKKLVSRDVNDVYIRNTNIEEINENDRVQLKVRHNITLNEAASLVFDEESSEYFYNMFNDEEKLILKFLAFDFSKDLHVIDSVHNGLVLGNIMMPLSINIDNRRGKVPYLLTDVSVMPLEVYEIVKRTIEQINVVLKTIIPELEIQVNRLHNETTTKGEEGVRVEFLTNKTDVPLPLKCESAGALKIISMLSALISVYNNPNACVVIDEFDAGVFEFLLGEILEVIDGKGRGQLIFTSHNLRILEVLNHKNLWFTTTNPQNRYIQLKGIKNFSNARDIYLRAVQLGGQNEEVYKMTKSFKIKKAFRLAGDSHGE